jgi:hypothetical protein
MVVPEIGVCPRHYPLDTDFVCHIVPLVPIAYPFTITVIFDGVRAIILVEIGHGDMIIAIPIYAHLGAIY